MLRNVNEKSCKLLMDMIGTLTCWRHIKCILDFGDGILSNHVQIISSYLYFTFLANRETR